MGLAGDDFVIHRRTHPEPERAPAHAPARRLGGGDAQVIPFPSRRESLAERLERERLQREWVDRERRARIERERAEHERIVRERLERRRAARLEQLRRERDQLRRGRRRRAAARAEPKPAPRPPAAPTPAPPDLAPRAPARRRGLFWPTAKAGLAVTLVLGLGAGLGTLVGLPVPGLDSGSARQTLAGSASLFGVDPGTPAGLTAGYVFPVDGPHDFGEAAARFGAERYGHTHEGQDVFAKPGTALVAVRDGIALDGAGGKSFYAYGGGNSFVMYSPSVDRSFVYLHMLHPSRLRAGDHVHAGQVIGQVGCTGSCDGPHLHFEIRIGRVAYGHEGKPIDPLPFLRQWPQPLAG